LQGFGKKYVRKQELSYGLVFADWKEEAVISVRIDRKKNHVVYMIYAKGEKERQKKQKCPEQD
jgi:hypothetical protein